MQPPLRLGLIGTGRIGTIHAENIARLGPQAVLRAISDVRLDVAQVLESRLGAAAHSDYNALLDDPSIDAVIVCSPTDTHADIIEAAAAAGKHVFCEKPIDLDVQRTRECLRAVESSGISLMVGFNRRFDPQFSHIAQQVRAGCIGDPHVVRITSRDPAPPPLDYVLRSGGLFLDMTIHDFDMARFLVDDEIIDVFATAASLVDPATGAAGDHDTAIIQMRYRSGALCCIDNSRRAVYGYDQRIEVFGSRGCLTAPNIFPYYSTLWNERGVTQESPHFFFLERYAESYRIELEQFVSSVLEEQPPPVDGVDGLQAALMAHAAHRSLTQQRPVALAEIPVAG